MSFTNYEIAEHCLLYYLILKIIVYYTYSAKEEFTVNYLAYCPILR
jgi:hypothetical protein